MFDNKKADTMTSRFMERDRIPKHHTLDSTPIGLNFEYSIRNNLHAIIYVFSSDGTEIDRISPSNQMVGSGLISLPLLDIDITYRKVNGDRNNKKDSTTQSVMLANVGYSEIQLSPVFIRELNIWLALGDQRSMVPNFQKNLETMVMSMSHVRDGGEPYPYVVYANIPDVDKYVYMSVDNAEIVRIPIIRSEFLSAGCLMFGRRVVLADGSTQGRSIKTTFEELTKDEDDVVVLDERVTMSLNLDSVRRYLKKISERELTDEDAVRMPSGYLSYMNSRIKKAVKLETEDNTKLLMGVREEVHQLNQDKIALQDNLTRSEAERKRLDALVGRLEAQMADDQKAARKEHDEKIGRQRVRTEFFKSTAVLMTAVVSTVAVLKAPILAAAKWMISKLSWGAAAAAAV